MSPMILIIAMSMLILCAANLIQDGNFQNIRSLDTMNYIPGQPVMYVAVCPSICNSWYSSNSGDIHLIQHFVMPQDIPTAVVDLQNSQHLKLCQNISSMQVGKIYQFTFDLVCFRNHSSCSAWIIWNNEVINGSNLTNSDLFSHTHLGYIQSTQENNTICYQGMQTPFIQYWGGRLDNTTLQLFVGIIPCNLLYCYSCVLNFPDACSICSSNSVKISIRRALFVPVLLKTAFKCQYSPINNYTCDQCLQQYILTSNGKICYTLITKFFTSEVTESNSYENGFLIMTNLSKIQLASAGIQENMVPSVQILVKNQIKTNAIISFTGQQFLMVKVSLQNSDEQLIVQFKITQKFPLVNNSLFSLSLIQLEILRNNFYPKHKYKSSPKLNKSQPLFSITSIFNYLNLMTFYSFLDVYQPKSFKIFIDTLIKQMSFFGFQQIFNLQDQVYGALNYTVQQKIPISKTIWVGPRQAGFQTNFYRNNLDSLTVLLITVIKLCLIWLIYKIFKLNYLRSSAAQRFTAVSTQFISIIPIFLLPAFNLVVKQLASRNYIQRINASLHLIVILFCFLAPFLEFINQQSQAYSNSHKNRVKLLQKIEIFSKSIEQLSVKSEIQSQDNLKNNILERFNQEIIKINNQEKRDLSQAIFCFFQRIFLLLVPTLIIFQNIIPFLIMNFCLLISNFILIIRRRKYLKNSQLLVKGFISLVWVIYHFTFCFFLIVQKWFLQQEADSANFWQQISKYIGYCTIVVVLLGCLIEIVICVIELGKLLKQIVVYCYKKCKIVNTVQPIKKEKTVKKEDNKRALNNAIALNQKTNLKQVSKNNRDRLFDKQIIFVRTEEMPQQQAKLRMIKIKKLRDQAPMKLLQIISWRGY